MGPKRPNSHESIAAGWWCSPQPWNEMQGAEAILPCLDSKCWYFRADTLWPSTRSAQTPPNPGSPPPGAVTVPCHHIVPHRGPCRPGAELGTPPLPPPPPPPLPEPFNLFPFRRGNMTFPLMEFSPQQCRVTQFPTPSMPSCCGRWAMLGSPFGSHLHDNAMVCATISCPFAIST